MSNPVDKLEILVESCSKAETNSGSCPFYVEGTGLCNMTGVYVKNFFDSGTLPEDCSIIDNPVKVFAVEE